PRASPSRGGPWVRADPDARPAQPAPLPPAGTPARYCPNRCPSSRGTRAGRASGKAVWVPSLHHSPSVVQKLIRVQNRAAKAPQAPAANQVERVSDLGLARRAAESEFESEADL